MAILKQSTTYTRMFLLVQSADHITGLTGATPAVTLSKAGGAFASAGGSITEVSSGWYKIALTTTDSNTLGDLAYHCTAASADPTDFVDQISVRLIDDLAFPATSGRSMVVDASGLVDANMVKLGPSGSGTAQTARDVGASVLLSTGTGTGQIDFTSGVVKSNMVQILATALTETAGLLAGGFKKFFNVASPTLTCLGVDQTGDSFSRIGTAGVGLTNLGDARIANLDAAVSTRSTYAGGAVASVTGNIGGNVVGSVGSVLAGVSVTTNNDKTGYSLAAGQLFLKKNVGFTLTFPMTNSTTHVPQTGLTITSQRSIDGAALGATTNSVTELSAGLYTLVVAAADVNGTQITFAMTATGADTKFITVVTQP